MAKKTFLFNICQLISEIVLLCESRLNKNTLFRAFWLMRYYCGDESEEYNKGKKHVYRFEHPPWVRLIYTTRNYR